MAKTTGIPWARSTFNSHIGCTKIGPGCDACYAEVEDSRKRWGGVTHWGPGVPRYRTSLSYWKQPLTWDRQAAKEREANIRWEGAPNMQPGFWPVFCASLGDVFDNEVPDQWRHDLFDLIHKTPNLSWLLVTKRISNAAKMVHRDVWKALPNVRLLITVVDEEEAYRDIPRLLALPCKNGVSYEPALGPVNWKPWLTSCGPNIISPDPHGRDKALQWIIVGGESSQGQHKARPFDVGWARSTVQQCKAAGVACFVKQLGSNPAPLSVEAGSVRERLWLKDRAGANPDEWPEYLRIRQFPK